LPGAHLLEIERRRSAATERAIHSGRWGLPFWFHFAIDADRRAEPRAPPQLDRISIISLIKLDPLVSINSPQRRGSAGGSERDRDNFSSAINGGCLRHLQTFC